MKIFSIASGSSGNAYFYESKGVKLIIDAGISFKRLYKGLLDYGISPYGFKGVFISHDHGDHSASPGVYQRKMGMPIFINPKTYNTIGGWMGKVKDIIHFYSNDTVTIGKIKIECVKTPHDGVDPVIFIIDDGEIRAGICTDLGHPFNRLKKIIPTLDVLFLESNYDDKLLAENTNYPEFLKRRIRGKHGHISNTECARLVKECTSDRLNHLFLSHLSESNNSPEIALDTFRSILGNNYSFELLIAPRFSSSKLITL